jgi:hypothetical protein
VKSNYQYSATYQTGAHNLRLWAVVSATIAMHFVVWPTLNRPLSVRLSSC